MVIEDKTIPLYFVIPASIHSGNKVTIPLATVSDIIISGGKLEPEKYYEIVSIEPSFPNSKGYKVGDRFTGISANITGKATVSEVVGAYPLKAHKFDSSPTLGTTNTGKIIVNLRISRHFIRHVKKLSQSDIATKTELMVVAKLQNAYIGKDHQDVIDRFPEMGEEGRLMQHSWSFES